MGKATKQSRHYPTPDQRQSVLAAKRNAKMARSAHAYVRGSAGRFYAWLADLPGGSLPDGPPIWICGDCHHGNLGPIAGGNGEVAVQIRDLDQTTIGNPVHDLLRLGLSLATAARSSNLPGVITARMMQALIEGYGQAFDGSHDGGMVHAQRPHVVRIAMKAALHRSWRALNRQATGDATPSIPLGKRFWPLSAKEKASIRALFESDSASDIYTALCQEAPGEGAMTLLDAAYWVKGCSSLGRRRYAVLLDIDGACSNGKPPILLDIKEAAGAAAPQQRGARIPRNAAQRVVEGARHVSPMLGNRMCASRVDRHAVVIRELMPQDLKLETERLTEADAVKAARFLALVVGQAHAQQMDIETRRAWFREMRRRNAKSSDAPPWLWRSIVDLVAAHEADYLEHCRRYALSGGSQTQRASRRPRQ
ncbi:DUF2252 family protein [Trinickia sp.]|uniref:DUF2252 family protein n=1 Tax=Trinickia sp. TaxID=2571163 RepID=UPI003F814AA2